MRRDKIVSFSTGEPRFQPTTMWRIWLNDHLLPTSKFLIYISPAILDHFGVRIFILRWFYHIIRVCFLAIHYQILFSHLMWSDCWFSHSHGGSSSHRATYSTTGATLRHFAVRFPIPKLPKSSRDEYWLPMPQSLVSCLPYQGEVAKKSNMIS